VDEFAEPRALLPLALAALAAGEPDAALQYARARARVAPPTAESYRIAALALERQGQTAEARDEVLLGLNVLPGSPLLLGYLSDQARAAGRYSEAIRLADDIVPERPSEAAEKQFLAARALRDQGRMSEAIQRAESGSAVLPEHAGPLVALSEYYAKAGRYAEAIARLERAAALTGTDEYRPRLEALRADSERADRNRRLRQLFEAEPDLPSTP
jgi:tetratricopeptide (TPR) repeat protein